MHVLISALPFAAFIIKAVKTDTAGGEEVCPLPHCEVFGSAALPSAG